MEACRKNEIPITILTRRIDWCEYLWNVSNNEYREGSQLRNALSCHLLAHTGHCKPTLKTSQGLAHHVMQSAEGAILTLEQFGFHYFQVLDYSAAL